MRITKQAALAGIGIFLIGATLGWTASSLLQHDGRENDIAIREYDERYPYIRPLLICQINEGNETRAYGELEAEIENVIETGKSEGRITAGSVYFRDLTSGKWTGVNELEPYAPASLLKVPIMISYFKEAEHTPGVLATRYPYATTREVVENSLVDTPLLRSGNSYTVNDLIRGMIIQSDNQAKNVLEEHADPVILKETYNVLGIQNPYDDDTEPYAISTKTYGLFFRVLYNGTYLSREMSNRAAELLTAVEFDRGLRAGTPSNIQIAHKYGIHSQSQDGALHIELSDCGIVYYPGAPYLLCVMMEGRDPDALAGLIKRVAEVTYRSVATNE
ncbi:MAG TPA: serine hydrolase [Candidatus Paceibacterota bacterium]|nr:serine hydrolase [Candidatus Paceibacterota bacterium]